MLVVEQVRLFFKSIRRKYALASKKMLTLTESNLFGRSNEKRGCLCISAMQNLQSRLKQSYKIIVTGNE